VSGDLQAMVTEIRRRRQAQLQQILQQAQGQQQRGGGQGRVELQQAGPAPGNSEGSSLLSILGFGDVKGAGGDPRIGAALQGAGAIGSALSSALGPSAATGAASVGASAGVLGGAASGGAATGGGASILSLLSTERVKQNIETEACVRELRWVSFEYVPELMLGSERHRGLIAEEVAVVHPEWVFNDEEGRPLGVRYDQIPRELWPTS
jgi:hypothetical protein